MIVADLAAAIRAVVSDLQAAVPDPADQLRVLATLASLDGTGPVAIRCRQEAAIALASASATYEPTSYDDAVAVVDRVASVLDREITAAGDVGDDTSYAALVRLRVTVVTDLMARGASLAPLVTVERATNLPALVVAQQLYGDATRADDLVRRVDPIHPLFMPTTMRVLAR